MDLPDEAATFIAEQHPRLVGLLGLYCGDRGVAEDLAQATLERVCRDWRRVRKKENPAAWSRRVAINLANSHFRRRAAERRAAARLQARSVDPPERDDLAALALREALSSLSSRQRTAVILHYYLDMTFPEVADVMGVPLSTSKSLASRGVARLRRSTELQGEGLTDAGPS